MSTTPASNITRNAVVLAVALASAAARADNIYLDVQHYSPTTIIGNATAPGHGGWVNLDSLDWSAQQSLNIGQTTGFEAGNVQFGSIGWTQAADRSVPPMLRDLATGTAGLASQFDIVDPVHGQASGTPYLSLTGSKTFFDNVGQNNSVVTGSMQTTGMTLTYNPAGLGLSGPAVSAGWNPTLPTPLSGTLQNGSINPTLPLNSTAPAAIAGGPVTMYLRLGGTNNRAPIAGSADVAGYENWIPVQSAGVDFSQPVNINSGTPTTGKVAFGALTWTQSIDASVVAAFANLAAGRNIDQATMEFVQATDAGPVTIEQMVFDDFAFKSLGISAGQTGPATATESIEFGGFSETDWSILPNGLQGASATFGWDEKRNISVPIAELPAAGFGAGDLRGELAIDVSAVPEPKSGELMLAALAMLAWLGKRAGPQA